MSGVEISCPYCGSPPLARQLDDGAVTCEYCRGAYQLPPRPPFKVYPSMHASSCVLAMPYASTAARTDNSYDYWNPPVTNYRRQL